MLIMLKNIRMFQYAYFLFIKFLFQSFKFFAKGLKISHTNMGRLMLKFKCIFYILKGKQWKLTEEGKLINIVLNESWKHGSKRWSMEDGYIIEKTSKQVMDSEIDGWTYSRQNLNVFICPLLESTN